MTKNVREFINNIKEFLQISLCKEDIANRHAGLNIIPAHCEGMINYVSKEFNGKVRETSAIN